VTTPTASGDPNKTGQATPLDSTGPIRSADGIDGTGPIHPADGIDGARAVRSADGVGGGSRALDHEARRARRIGGSSEPVWIYALAGWLLAVTQVDGGARGASEAEIRQRLPYGGLGELDGDLDTMTVRALRRLPAIGPARALAIARARWEDGLTGGPESWDVIRGIGPETVEAIRRHLAEAAIRGPRLEAPMRRHPPEESIRRHLSEADGAGAQAPAARGAAVQAVHASEPRAESRTRF